MLVELRVNQLPVLPQYVKDDIFWRAIAMLPKKFDDEREYLNATGGPAHAMCAAAAATAAHALSA